MAIESYYGIDGISIESVETIHDLYEALDAIQSMVYEDWEENGQPKNHVIHTKAFEFFNDALKEIQMLDFEGEND
jgi:hypothetical protein